MSSYEIKCLRDELDAAKAQIACLNGDVHTLAVKFAELSNYLARQPWNGNNGKTPPWNGECPPGEALAPETRAPHSFQKPEETTCKQEAEDEESSTWQDECTSSDDSNSSPREDSCMAWVTDSSAKRSLLLRDRADPIPDEDMVEDSTPELPSMVTTQFTGDTWCAACAVLTHIAESGREKWSESFNEATRYIVCLLNVAAQIYVLYITWKYVTSPQVSKAQHLYKLYEDDIFPDGDFDKDRWHTWGLRTSICQFPLVHREFCYVLLCLWTATMLVEVKQTAHLMKCWYYLESVKPGSQRLTTLDGAQINIVRTTRSTKAVVLMTILLPKLMIALICWWIGCRWLIASSALADLILNSLALGFITQIDELIYQVLEPREMQEWVENHGILRENIFYGYVNPATSGYPRVVAMLRRLLEYAAPRKMVFALLTFGTPLLYMKFQIAIPGYRWDVQAHCESLHSLVSEEHGHRAGHVHAHHR